MNAGPDQRFQTSPGFGRFARMSVLVAVVAVVAGAFAPGTGRAAEPSVGDRQARIVRGLTTTTLGLSPLDLAVAREAVVPEIEEAAAEMRRREKIIARVAGEGKRWEATLDADVVDLMAAIAASGVAPEPVAASVSVDELFAVAVTRADRVAEWLDEVVATVEVLERHVGKAAAAGAETERYADLAETARTWEQSQRRAADPHLCSSVLPDGAGEWPAARLGDYEPYLDCLAERITPRVEAVVGIGHALNAALAEITS